jgi:hypothetical protein
MILMPGSSAKPKLRSAVYVPGAELEMWTEPVPPDDAFGNWRGYSLRQLVLPLANSGRQFRFTFWKAELAIDRVSFEIQATNYQTQYTPVEIKIGGASGITAGILGQSVVSDWMETSHVIGASHQMIVIFDIGSIVTGGGRIRGSSALRDPPEPLLDPFKCWSRTGASYNLAAPSGTWTLDQVIKLTTVKRIEVR